MVWNQDKTRLTLIDFEYSSINFRGYDIASYINESMLDYSHPVNPKFKVYLEYFHQFLEEGEFDRILTYYLCELHRIMSERNADFAYKADKKGYVQKELPILKDQVQRSMLMSDIQWAFWSLIMMPLEDLAKCEAFYMQYAVARMEMYFQHRPLFLGSASLL